MKKIRKCPNCKTYTMKEICPTCNSETKIAHPPNPKFVKYLKHLTKEENI